MPGEGAQGTRDAQEGERRSITPHSTRFRPMSGSDVFGQQSCSRGSRCLRVGSPSKFKPSEYSAAEGEGAERVQVTRPVITTFCR